MSHLHCAFTLRAERKHQFDTYLVIIHLVVHKISLFYIFFASFSNRDIGISAKLDS